MPNFTLCCSLHFAAAKSKRVSGQVNKISGRVEHQDKTREIIQPFVAKVDFCTLLQTNRYPNGATVSQVCVIEYVAANNLRAVSTYFITLNIKGLDLQMWRVDCQDGEGKFITAHFSPGARQITTQTINAKYVC